MFCKGTGPGTKECGESVSCLLVAVGPAIHKECTPHVHVELAPFGSSARSSSTAQVPASPRERIGREVAVQHQRSEIGPAAERIEVVVFIH